MPHCDIASWRWLVSRERRHIFKKNILCLCPGIPRIIKISLNETDGSVWRFYLTKFTYDIFSQISMFVFSSVALVKFASKGDNQYVIVGTVKDLVLSPRSCAGGFLHVYMLSGENSESLTFMHKTPVDDVPGYITPFQGRVLVGVGKYLRIYDLGKCKLLRKCENKVNRHQLLYSLILTIVLNFLNIEQNIEIYLDFTSFINTGIMHVIEIHSQGRQ